MCAIAHCPAASSPHCGTVGRQRWEVWDGCMGFVTLPLYGITLRSAVSGATENFFCFSHDLHLNPRPWLVWLCMLMPAGKGYAGIPLLAEHLSLCWGGFWAGRRSRLPGAGRASSGVQPQEQPSRGSLAAEPQLQLPQILQLRLQISQGCRFHHPRGDWSCSPGNGLPLRTRQPVLGVSQPCRGWHTAGDPQTPLGEWVRAGGLGPWEP